MKTTAFDSLMSLYFPQITDATKLPSENPVYIPQTGNITRSINPYYTQQQPHDSFEPMAMYQNYKRTGLLPEYSSNFVSNYVPPSVSATPISSSQPVSNAAPSSPTFGGK